MNVYILKLSSNDKCFYVTIQKKLRIILNRKSL